MKRFFYTLMALVLVVVSCTKLETPDDLRLNQMQSEEVSRKAKEQPKDTLTFNRDLKVNGNEAIATLTALVNGEAKATATTRIREYRQKNFYGITAEQRSITPEYANAKVSFSEENGVKANFPQEDGNIIYVEVSYTDTKVELNGEEKDVLADRLDVVKVFNLDEIEAAAATKAVVTDTVYNKTVVEFRLENYQDESYLEDETEVRYYSYNVADPVVPTTDEWEPVANEAINGERYSSVDHVQYYSDGSRSLIKNYSARIPVSAKVLSNWERTAKDFTQTTSQIQETTDKVAANNGDGLYWINYTISIANEVVLNEGNASNRWEVVEPRELVVKENGEVVYTFSELYATKVADGGKVDENGYYSCTLSFNYDNYKVDLVAPGKIVKEEEPVAEPVKTEGWDEESSKDELTDNSRITSVDYVWYEDGKEVDRQSFELTSARSLECLTNWTSEQESYSQNTNAASFTTSSDADAKGEWSFNKTTVVIKNAATLADGSKMNNEWRAYEVTNIKVTYNGKSYEFSNKEIYVSDNANVDANGVYGDKLTYIYGDNAKYVTAPGMITLKENPEPEDPIVTPADPKVESMVQTVAPTGDKKGYVYTLIVKWDNGMSLPVVINNGVISTFDKVENLDSRVNGLSLNANGEWVLSIAEDSAENMTYITTDGKLNCQMSYTKANRIGWDEGKTVNGHSSVHTSRYNVSVDGVITDTYTNSTVGTL